MKSWYFPLGKYGVKNSDTILFAQCRAVYEINSAQVVIYETLVDGLKKKLNPRPPDLDSQLNSSVSGRGITDCSKGN